MRYRAFGKLPFKVSEIGLGGHREGVETRAGLARTARFFLPAAERAQVVAAALEAGVNYFDSTYGCELMSLCESLRLVGRPQGVFISAMRVDFFKNLLDSPLTPREYARSELESRLREGQLERVEQFLLGAMESGDPLSQPAKLEEALDELQRLRQSGKVAALGFSCHDADYAARLLQRFPVFDSVMTPYNYANRQAEGALAEALQQTGAAWIAMKNLVWRAYGIPVTALRLLQPPPGEVAFDPDAPIGRLSLQFILQHPKLTTCVPAANNVAEIAENVAASGAEPLTAQGSAQLEQFARATLADDGVVQALAGLIHDNLRVRACALGFLKAKLKLDVPDIDWEADDAPARAAAVSQRLLDDLRRDARWRPWLH